MRQSIRTSSQSHLHADVNKALLAIDIDDRARYRSTLITDYPGKPTTSREEVLSGAQVRRAIRTQLLTSMDQILQDRRTITLHSSKPNKEFGFRTQTCIYTKL